MTRTITATTLLLAGALLSGGCQHAVYGDRTFHSDNVYGDREGFARPEVYGEASFRDQTRVSGPTQYSRPPVESAQAASHRSDMPSRPDLAARTETSTDVPRDEVARSNVTSTDADRPAARNDQPAPVAAQAPVPAPVPASDRQLPADRPATSDRPAATPSKDDTPVRNDAKPEVANDAGLKTSTNAPDGRDPEMVARANSARYPDDLKPIDDAKLVATASAPDRALRLINHSDREIVGGNLWVNEMYVTPVPSLRPGEGTTVLTNQFFNHDGKALPSLAESSKLQLQSGGNLYNVRLAPPRDDASLNK